MQIKKTWPVTLALAAFALAAAAAGDSTPIVIHPGSSPDAPFKLSVTSARLIREAGGKNAIAFEVNVTNTTSGSLVTTSGWSLNISKPDGTLARRVKVAQGFDVDPGKTQKARHILDSEAIGSVEATDRFDLVPATGATISYGQRCQGPDGNCDAVEARCEALCNNPLVPQGGVARFSCTCHWWWDSQGECWRYVCPSTCECVGLPEPPYHEPYIPF